MAHMTFPEIVNTIDSLFISMMGENNYQRWKTLKHQLSLISEKEFVSWLLDSAELRCIPICSTPTALVECVPSVAGMSQFISVPSTAAISQNNVMTQPNHHPNQNNHHHHLLTTSHHQTGIMGNDMQLLDGNSHGLVTTAQHNHHHSNLPTIQPSTNNNIIADIPTSATTYFYSLPHTVSGGGDSPLLVSHGSAGLVDQDLGEQMTGFRSRPALVTITNVPQTIMDVDSDTSNQGGPSNAAGLIASTGELAEYTLEDGMGVDEMVAMRMGLNLNHHHHHLHHQQPHYAEPHQSVNARDIKLESGMMEEISNERAPSPLTLTTNLHIHNEEQHGSNSNQSLPTTSLLPQDYSRPDEGSNSPEHNAGQSPTSLVKQLILQQHQHQLEQEEQPEQGQLIVDSCDSGTVYVANMVTTRALAVLTHTLPLNNTNMSPGRSRKSSTPVRKRMIGGASNNNNTSTDLAPITSSLPDQHLRMPTTLAPTGTIVTPSNGDLAFKTCHICNKSFSDRPTMLRHQRIVHFKLRPHACQHCQKTFCQKSNLKNHLGSCAALISSGSSEFMNTSIEELGESNISNESSV